MRIKIVQIGKTKAPFAHEEAEFLKRMKPYAQVEIVGVKDEDRINVKDNDFVVVLDEGGTEMTSSEFAKFLETYKDYGQTVVFIIGGPYGLSESVKKSADARLSLSKMTFTHLMARLFLLEQIYRGICIIQGKEYHND